MYEAEISSGVYTHGIDQYRHHLPERDMAAREELYGRFSSGRDLRA